MRDTQKRVVTYFLVVMSVVILLLTVTACKEKGTDIPPEKMLSSDLDSLMFSLDGVIYTFPVHYSELEANGWMPHDPDNRFATDTLEQGGDDRWELMHGNQNISVTLANLSENVVSFRDSYITDVLVLVRENVPVNYNASLILPGNIQIGSTSEDIYNIYGKDIFNADARMMLYEGFSTFTLMYSSEKFTLQISIDSDLNSVFMVSYWYNHISQLALNPTPIPQGENQNPKPLKVVEGLYDNLDSLMFALNDVIYTLPVHFSAFEANGWYFYEEYNRFTNIQHSPTSVLKPGARSLWWVLTDGERFVDVNFTNLSVNALSVNACYITNISPSQHYREAEVIFPGGILVGVAYSDVLTLYGEPNELTNSASEEFYRAFYRKDNLHASIRICNQSDIVIFIGMSYLGR